MITLGSSKPRVRTVTKRQSSKFTNYYFVAIPRNEDTYYASVGLLFVTPEDKTALNIHEDFIRNKINASQELFTHREAIPEVFLNKELQLLTLLLSSTNNRVNKSSSLWLLLRRLYVLKRELFPSLHFDYLDLCLESAQQHISNYYCWNTLRWFYDFATNEEKDAILVGTRSFCYRHLKDSSSWYTYSSFLSQSYASEDFNRNEYMRHCEKYGLRHHALQCSEGPDEKRLISEIIEIKSYIDRVEVLDSPPYICILKLLRNVSPNKRLDLFEDWNQETANMEKENAYAALRTPSSPLLEDQEDDLLLRIKFQRLKIKLQFMQNLLKEGFR